MSTARSATWTARTIPRAWRTTASPSPHQGKRWYLSAGLPKSLGGNFVIAGFEITDGDELVIYNLDVERIVEDLGGQLDGETVDSEQGKGALVRSPLEKVFAYLNDPANSDVFVEAARFQRVTQ